MCSHNLIYFHIFIPSRLEGSFLLICSIVRIFPCGLYLDQFGLISTRNRLIFGDKEQDDVGVVRERLPKGLNLDRCTGDLPVAHTIYIFITLRRLVERSQCCAMLSLNLRKVLDIEGMDYSPSQGIENRSFCT